MRNVLEAWNHLLTVLVFDMWRYPKVTRAGFHRHKK